MIKSLIRFICCGLITSVMVNGAMAQMIVAHRGASHDAPENTLSAFRLAWEQGADGVEGDFYLTADDEIVCIHDRDTKRTAGKNLMVEQSTLGELRQLEYGRWKDEKFAGEPIPTLEEVIATVPDGKTLVIELKSTLQIVPKLVETFRKHQSKPIQWIVITFDAPTAAEFKRQMPFVKTHWLTSFKRKPPSMSYRPTAQQIASIVSEAGLDGVGMNGTTRVIDKDFIETLKAGGCSEFHVWTVDDVATSLTFQSIGAMGITTNVPAVIRQATIDSTTP